MSDDTTPRFDPQPGDRVAVLAPSIRWRGDRVKFGTVKRVTKTQVVVNHPSWGVEARFRRADHYEVGSRTARRILASPDDPKVIDTLMTQKADMAANTIATFGQDTNSLPKRASKTLTDKTFADARAAIDMIEAAWRENR